MANTFFFSNTRYLAGQGSSARWRTGRRGHEGFSFFFLYAQRTMHRSAPTLTFSHEVPRLSETQAKITHYRILFPNWRGYHRDQCDTEQLWREPQLLKLRKMKERKRERERWCEHEETRVDFFIVSIPRRRCARAPFGGANLFENKLSEFCFLLLLNSIGIIIRWELIGLCSIFRNLNARAFW